MTVRLFPVSLSAALILSLFAVEASADHRKRHRQRNVENYYAGPEFVKRVPGMRLFFGDYALTEEEFDALYGEEQDRFDESYYEPEVAAPAPKKKTVKKDATKSTSNELTTASTSPAPLPKAKPKPETTVTTEATAASSTGLSCDKATDIVTGYGFQTVKAETCNGKTYAFNATRDGKQFAIKLDSASGELTEVKKLQ
jgi:hypothetical protein